MPRIDTKLEYDLIVLVKEYISGLSDMQTGIPGTCNERREALLSIVEPGKNHPVADAAKEAVANLSKLLNDEKDTCELYLLSSEQYKAFRFTAFSLIYSEISRLYNLTEEEEKNEDQEGQRFRKKQFENRPQLETRLLNPRNPEFILSREVLAARKFTAIFCCLLAPSIIIGGAFGLSMLADEENQENATFLAFALIISVVLLSISAKLTLDLARKLYNSNTSFIWYNTFLSKLLDRRDTSNSQSEHESLLSQQTRENANYQSSNSTESLSSVIIQTDTQNQNNNIDGKNNPSSSITQFFNSKDKSIVERTEENSNGLDFN